MINYVIIAIACLAAGFFVGYLMLGTFNKKARREMEAEAELLKKNKEIEAKERFIALKAEHEQQVQQRNAKIQSAEVKLQQRELQINQRQGDLQRKMNETEVIRENLEQQLLLVEN